MDKKIYNAPQLEIVDMEMEGGLLLPVSNTEVDSGLAPEFDDEIEF